MPAFLIIFFQKNYILAIWIIHFLIFKIFKTDLEKKKYVLHVVFEPGTYCLLILCSASELTGIVVNVQKNQI